jgi:hypothetical protein
MKLHVALFCLIGGPLVACANSAADLVQDKPDLLYVVSDTLFHDAYSDNVTYDNSGGVAEGQVWHQDDYQWQEGVGGNGSRQDSQESDDWDSDGWLWSETNRTSSVMLWETNGNGTEIYTANDGSTATYPIGLPLLTSEHCLVNDPKSPPCTLQDLGDGNWVTNHVYEEYVRHAQTRWRLQTGGRGGRSSLFRLSVTVARILDKRAERPFSNANSEAVPPQSITVMGRQLYPDTNLWIVLPDGTNLEATPFVAGVDFYRMDPSEQKYIPSLTVNDLSLDGGTPEFCAGQYLTFQLAFDPPPPSASQVSAWDLPGAPVNEGWQGSTNGSVNYRFNSNLLTNLATTCWYSSGGGTAIAGTALQFANGQSCSLYVQGSFSIAKPSFSEFDNCSSLVGFAWNSPVLLANMQWAVTIQSAFDGSLGVTQLIDGTNVCCNTGGAFLLDGTNQIYNTTSTYSPTNPATHTARFIYTRNATANPTADLAANFKDYLRFLPAGNAANIWVTLGTNLWSMDGSASLSSGLIRNNLPPDGPLGKSDEFPSWSDRYGQ